jgi:hypothetical protein
MSHIERQLKNAGHPASPETLLDHVLNCTTEPDAIDKHFLERELIELIREILHKGGRRKNWYHRYWLLRCALTEMIDHPEPLPPWGEMKKHCLSKIE